MPLSKSLKSHLVREYDYVADQIASESVTPLRKMFYFSVVYGEATRILNLDWDPNLAFIHQVAKDAYQQINTAVTQWMAGNETFQLDQGALFRSLARSVRELADNLKGSEWDDAALCVSLRRITALTYSVLGNGQYLAIRGKLKIPD